MSDLKSQSRRVAHFSPRKRLLGICLIMKERVGCPKSFSKEK